MQANEYGLTTVETAIFGSAIFLLAKVALLPVPIGRHKGG